MASWEQELADLEGASDDEPTWGASKSPDRQPGRKQRASKLWTILRTSAALEAIYDALVASLRDPAVIYSEHQCLRLLILVSRQFRAAFEAVLYSAVVVGSDYHYEKLFHALSHPTRGPERLVQLAAVRLIDVSIKNVNRFLIVTGDQLRDLQLQLIASDAKPIDERQRTRLIAGLSKCRKIQRFSYRGDAISPDKLSSLLAIWPRLTYLDLDRLLPAPFADCDIKVALLPRLTHIVLHHCPTDADGHLEAFLRPFARYLETLAILAFPSSSYPLPTEDVLFKRMKTLIVDATGGVDADNVLELVHRSRLPSLRQLVVQGGLGTWRQHGDGDMGALLAACAARGIEIVSLAA